MHVALTVDEAGKRVVYQDGTPYLELEHSSQTTPSLLRFAFADSYDGKRDMYRVRHNYSLDEVRIYGRTLTQEEIVSHRQNDLDGTPVDPKDLLGYWSFDPGSDAFSLKDGAALTPRTSAAAFPGVAYLIATEAGLDILDAQGHQPWMHFGENGLGRSILQSGVRSIEARAGEILLTGTSPQTLYQLLFDPNHNWIDSYNNYTVNALRYAPCFTELICDRDLCLEPGSGCSCAANRFASIACRHNQTAASEENSSQCINQPILGTGFGASYNESARIISVEGLGLQKIGDLGGSSAMAPGSPWSGLRHLQFAGEDLYFVAENQTSGCQRIYLLKDVLGGSANWSDWSAWNAPYFYAGSLNANDEDSETACGSPVVAVTALKVDEGLSTKTAGLNTVYMATNSSVVLLQEASHDVGATEVATHIRWLPSGAEGEGFKVLPAGPYTAIEPCGGLIYVGTTNHGIAVLNPEIPYELHKSYSEPMLPSSQIREISCSETGPAPGLHRVLAATPEGAVEVVGKSE